ncbi:hypothetical protein WH47_10044, partial [Habropoda laboriosa]
SSTELPTFSNSTSLKMFEEITTKVWRALPVISIPQSLVLAYCMKYTEISEEVEKAAMQCQYDGTNWDCTFIEMGGGQDDFNIGKIVSLYHNLSNRGLRSKLLRGAEICGKIWQKYKRVQDKRLIPMQLHVRIKNRVKRFSKVNKNLPRSKINQKRLKKRKEAKRDEEIKNAKQTAKEIKVIRQKLTNKIAELETKKSLNPQEETELDKLYLTILQICLKDTLLLDKLHDHLSNCNNYPCMFSKVIENESMKSISSIIRNDTIDEDISQKFKQGIQDCIVWWKLFKHFDKNANPRRELGRCLFQTFSFKCKESVFDKVRLLLITTEGK